MSASLIDRVRERLAAESGPLRPNVVAAAIRAESGGVLGDSEVLNSLRVLQTELTGAGILEPLLCADGTTDVLVTAPDAVRSAVQAKSTGDKISVTYTRNGQSNTVDVTLTSRSQAQSS